jgi:hypothetical protein
MAVTVPLVLSAVYRVRPSPVRAMSTGPPMVGRAGADDGVRDGDGDGGGVDDGDGVGVVVGDVGPGPVGGDGHADRQRAHGDGLDGVRVLVSGTVTVLSSSLVTHSLLPSGLIAAP